MKKTLKNIIQKLPVQYQVPIYKGYRKYVRPESHRQIQSLRSSVNEEGYSLKGYDDLNCIFVRIPKCASQSISKALFGNLGGGHRSIFQYRLIFSPQEFDKYFKFTFVRNPWDRVASAFFYHRERWPSSIFASFPDLNSFVHEWLDEENIATVSAFRPQHTFICGTNNNIELDFIGYFENIEEDFNKVTQKLGIDCRLKTTNKTNIKKRDYRTYFDEKSIQIVAELYQKDILLLGYDFDNSSF